MAGADERAEEARTEKGGGVTAGVFTAALPLLRDRAPRGVTILSQSPQVAVKTTGVIHWGDIAPRNAFPSKAHE